MVGLLVYSKLLYLVARLGLRLFLQKAMQYMIYLDKSTLALAYHSFDSFIWITTISKSSQCSSPLFKECWCFWYFDAAWNKWNLLSLQLAYRQVPSSTLAPLFLQFVPSLVLIKADGSRWDNVVLGKTHLSVTLFIFPQTQNSLFFGQKFCYVQTYPFTVQNLRNSRTTNWKK